jgi:hypothetical protein
MTADIITRLRDAAAIVHQSTLSAEQVFAQPQSILVDLLMESAAAIAEQKARIGELEREQALLMFEITEQQKTMARGTDVAQRLERVWKVAEQRADKAQETVYFMAKWVERGLFDKAISGAEALNVIAYYPGAPWHFERWDVDHKPYAADFYKAFPKARAFIDMEPAK